jgi:hypothetical protein
MACCSVADHRAPAVGVRGLESVDEGWDPTASVTPVHIMLFAAHGSIKMGLPCRIEQPIYGPKIWAEGCSLIFLFNSH